MSTLLVNNHTDSKLEKQKTTSLSYQYYYNTYNTIMQTLQNT